MRRIIAIAIWSLAFYFLARIIMRSTVVAVVGVQDRARYFTDASVKAAEALAAWKWVLAVAAFAVASITAWLGWLPGTSTRQGAVRNESQGWLCGAIAVALMAGFLNCVAIMHVVRSDLDPVRHFLSEYATGKFGCLMIAGMIMAGLGSMTLSIALWRAVTPSFWLLLSCCGSMVAGLGYVAAGVFVADPPRLDDVALPPSITEILHGVTSGNAAFFATMVFLVLPLAFWHCPRWRSLFWQSAAAACLVFTLHSMISRLPGGLGQRLWVIMTTLCAMFVACRLWMSRRTTNSA
jgi:hypothetical protein